MTASSPQYLLDTNVLSEPLRPEPNANVVTRLRDVAGRFAIASVAWHELLFGVERMAASRRRDYLQRYLHEVVRPGCDVIAYDERAATWHARERARLAQLGRPPSFVDGQIASVAATQGLVLATRNVSDFEPFDGLTIEDWFAVSG